MLVEKGLILSNDLIALDTYKMVIKAEMVESMKPGQFVNIKVEGYMLRRPISICSIDTDSFVIIYKVVGDGTKRMSKMKVNNTVELFGPLGSTFIIHNDLREVLLIGGGVGVPPLYEVAKRYSALDIKVNVVLGFNDKYSVFYKEEFEELGCNVFIATMDGSYGVKGTTIDAIKHYRLETDFVYSCGPVPMLKAVESNYKKGYVSFESRMACGMGVCMGCVCKDKENPDKYHRICKEGPVFEIGKVII